MKKGMIAVVTAVLVGTVGLAFACGKDDKGAMADKGMMKGMMMKHHMMGTIQGVATSDGGVVIIRGDDLYKYDRNLKLIGQADLPGEMKGMKKDCDCPMMKKMEKMDEGNKGSLAPKTEAKPANAVDHANHH